MSKLRYRLPRLLASTAVFTFLAFQIPCHAEAADDPGPGPVASDAPRMADDAPATVAPEPGSTGDAGATASTPEARGAGTPAAVSTRVSLGDALALGWRDNPQVKQAELALQATQFDISGARAGYYPYATIQTGGGTEYDYTVLRVIQPLWDGGLTSAQVRVAKAQQKIALAQLAKIRLELGLQIAENYLNIVQAEERRNRYNDYVVALERLLNVIRRRAEEGVATQADVQTAVTRYNQAAASRAANESALLASRSQLQALLGRPVAAVSWPGDNTLFAPADVDKVGQGVVALHPDRQIVDGQVQLQKATAERSKASLWPQLQAQYSRQITGRVVDPTDESTTMLVLQYQTNNGLAGYRSYQAETERLAATEASVETARQAIEAQIAVARAQWVTASAQLELQRLAADSATELVDSFLRQFEAGRKTWLEVLNAQREANETLVAQIGVKQSLWLANARLALQTLHWRRLSEQAPYVDVISE